MYKRILFPVDLSDESSWRKALDVALTLRKSFGAQLHVLTVFPDLPVDSYRLYLPKDTEERLAAAAQAGIEAFVRDHVPDDGPVETHIATGSVYRAIMETAERIGADLIIMASHRPETADYLLGPNAARVVRHAGISVMVVR